MRVRQGLGRTAVFAVALWLHTAAPAAAQQPADKATIDSRVALGVRFLKGEQKKATGAWGDGDGAAAVGRTALTGIALIESGVSVTDPCIKQAANFVRLYTPDLDSTYDMSLAILFLDRLKDQKEKNEKDKQYIQLLAGRLIASQMASGGWGYKAQKYGEQNVLRLIAALKKVSAATPDKPVDMTKVRANLPENMRRLAVWSDGAGRLPADPAAVGDKRNDLYDAATDNSNTHLAMVGLWTARKYEIPVDRTFVLVNRRFRTSQGPGGTWAYDFVRTGADGNNAMTCIALLGIAIGHVVAPEPDVKPETDPVIINAFVALDKAIGAPVGDTTNRPKVKDVGGLYFLWSMERIAVLYDLQKLNKKDWYQWGAEILISNQSGDGSWEEGGFSGQSPLVNTCLALLFLKRANLLPDLSKRLTVDPGALAAKVDIKLAPKIDPPTNVIETAPPPHTVQPKPVPVPLAVPPAPTPAPRAQPQAEAEAPEPAKKTPWLWIVLGLFLLGLLGLGLLFLFMRRGDEDEEADEEEDSDKKKKKAKKKRKVASDGDESPKSAAPKKARPLTTKKAKVEVDEDE
ncbi:hypothetical protein [Frigoriglobus tundricola]|uniref:Squalene cyclase C-terminal domain-containing protein n=1 Tax=Frigoriglobus tundricola TaxID=2774151 RepID=A0A6M5YUB2_9BACT|nr:hypothetical protein [Frigoriglobus tundricola]QJW97658.1 hypothetical protein FTUN_5235 [Frigoriglobus tundricola]